MEIVGLKNFVDDDVHKLIAKFVGFQSKTAKAVEGARGKFQAFEKEYEDHPFFARRPFDEWLIKQVVIQRQERLHKTLRRLEKIRSIPKRREAFTKLSPWLRRFLINKFFDSILPESKVNNKFMVEQISELKMRWKRPDGWQEVQYWVRHYYSNQRHFEWNN